MGLVGSLSESGQSTFIAVTGGGSTTTLLTNTAGAGKVKVVAKALFTNVDTSTRIWVALYLVPNATNTEPSGSDYLLGKLYIEPLDLDNEPLDARFLAGLVIPNGSKLVAVAQTASKIRWYLASEDQT